MKSIFDNARADLLLGVHLEVSDIPTAGNYTIRRKDAPYELSISRSVLQHGATFTNMVMQFVAMKRGPWHKDGSVQNFTVKASGQEGSFFYRNHLVRWYIDLHDRINPSLYVMIDERSSWLNQLVYRLSSMKKRRKQRSESRKMIAS
jgi:hypothetical protein